MLLDVLPADWPCDPRSLLLAVAMSRKFSRVRLPAELEWARAGLGHVLGQPLDGEVAAASVPADWLCSPAHVARMAEGVVMWAAPATARTAYEWFHDTCLFAQLAAGPVRLGRDELPVGVDVTAPQEGRGLWLTATDFSGGTVDLWAVGRSSAGAVAVEGLGRCPARLDELPAMVEAAPLSPRTAFQLAEVGVRAVAAARRADWGAVGRLVNSAWAVERAASGDGRGDLAVLAALEGGGGKRGARATGGLLVTVGETV